MTEELKGKAGETVDDDLITAGPVSDDVQSGDQQPVSGDSPPVVPHSMDSEVTLSIDKEELRCPQCGKSTLRAEFPDQYEAWLKCSSCGFFMGMSNDDWHRMENSPNINEKIVKMASKKE
jgi:predicted RNA-binding Zn-ribbon protein involved in translation (DUF1610 family)